MKKSILKLAGVAMIVTISLINFASKSDVVLISDIGLDQIQMIAVASSEAGGGGVTTCHSVTSCDSNYTTITYSDGKIGCCKKYLAGHRGHYMG